jgi:hypothetical protein
VLKRFQKQFWKLNSKPKKPQILWLPENTWLVFYGATQLKPFQCFLCLSSLLKSTNIKLQITSIDMKFQDLWTSVMSSINKKIQVQFMFMDSRRIVGCLKFELLILVNIIRDFNKSFSQKHLKEQEGYLYCIVNSRNWNDVVWTRESKENIKSFPKHKKK